MKYYKTGSYGKLIKEVEVTKETEKCIYVKNKYNGKEERIMKDRNYAIMVDENSHYPVSYTIKQSGEKVIENTMLKGGDMTENQIKELFFLGYFEEKPTLEEVDGYLDYILMKKKCSNPA